MSCRPSKSDQPRPSPRLPPSPNSKHRSDTYRKEGALVTTQYLVPSEKVRIGAGTALKFGFFAAFGIFLFYLILSVILGAAALALAAAGAFNIHNLLPG